VKSSHQPAPKFVFRTPVLPFSALSAAITDLASLRRWLDDPANLEAVFVASPDLAEHVEAWRQKAEPDPAIERTIVRYLSRMAGRSTPFGLFSGVAIGSFGAATKIEIAARGRHGRHTRLDNDYLFSLCDELLKDPAIRGELTYTPNTSLYPSSGRWRYAEARVDGGGRSYHLVAVDATDYLDAVLTRAHSGATLAQLVDVLVADPEITREEAEGFIGELVAAQLLLPELQPYVTGPEPAEGLIRILSTRPAGKAAATTLIEVNRAIAAIDATPLGTPPDAYRAIAKQLEVLPAQVKLPRLFQVDLNLGVDVATLGPAVIAELERGVDLERRLGVEPGETQWTRFRAAFETRYEGREVPLVEVLDEEAGIGFGETGAPAQTPLIADLAFPYRAGAGQTSWGTREAYLVMLHAGAIARGATEIELTDADLEVLASKTATGAMPDTFAAMVEVIAESAQAVDEGRFQLRLNGVGTSSATRLLGRFCHGMPAMTELVGELIAAEEKLHPDVMFAEVVHLPEGRIGNILIRPLLRKYELAYLGKSGADLEHQIPITDLMVSVVNGRVVLRSKRLGKEIRPQLASAHNFSARSLVIYRFLCAVAMQDLRGGGWSWGALDDAPFLPRVRRGKLILSRATWLLRRTELEQLDKAAKGGKAAKTQAQHDEVRARQLAAVQALRDARRLPRWIVVADYDNELPVDLENALSVDSFVHLVKGRPVVTIHELLPGPESLMVRGPEGAYMHELVVPFVRTEESARAATPARKPMTGARRFAPGSPWLYVKLYGGITNAEAVLRDTVWPFAREVRAEGLASQFFFIRYADPDNHVRVRFRGDPARLTGELLPRLSEKLQPAIDAGLLWRIQLDTYEREVERYGGDHGIELAEALFDADSAAVLAIVDSCRGDEGAAARWRLALRGIDQLLADLGLTVADRHKLMTGARDGFGAEVGMDTEFQRRLGDKFRTHRNEIADLLAAPADDESHPFSPGLAAFAERSRQLAPVAAALRDAAAADKLTSSIPDLAGSYVHMHVNRMLSAAQRRQELVLYDLLRRHYDGVVAREKAAAKKLNA
jgi:thiopeptide-type bacteriocin biosynthesis protein